MPIPILDPAPPWPRDPVEFMHGCVATDAAGIARAGVDPTKGRPDTDFGQGFYLTTNRQQAKHWAWLKYYSLSPSLQKVSGGPAVLSFYVPSAVLQPLIACVFVR